MLDEIRANSWAPRSVTREAREISSAMADLHMEGSVTPSSKDIAKKLEITLDEYYAALDRVSRGRLPSFDELAADGRDSDDLVDHSGKRLLSRCLNEKYPPNSSAQSNDYRSAKNRSSRSITLKS